LPRVAIGVDVVLAGLADEFEAVDVIVAGLTIRRTGGVDLETRALEPLENFFGAKVLPVS
jgi:hypothetical protein